MTKFVFALAAVGALSACQTSDSGEVLPSNVIYQIDVDDDFTETSNRFVSSTLPVVITKWRTQVHEGKIVICGAKAFPQPSLVTAANSMIAAMHITYEDREILRGMQFFKHTPGGTTPKWGKANCVSTGESAPEGPYRVFMNWDAGRHRI
ncbi:hypothetical protein ACS3SW_17630 [Roseobacteraceae bacterium S113]